MNQRVSARVIPQVCGERKNVGAICGEFAGALFDSFGCGSDCDFRPLLCKQTSSCEAYPLRATRTSDESHFSGKVHLLDFTTLYSIIGMGNGLNMCDPVGQANRPISCQTTTLAA